MAVGFLARMSGLIRGFAENAWVNAMVGLVIIATSLVEIDEILVDDIASLKGAHGMLLFGVQHVLRTVPTILENLAKLGEGAEKARALAGGRPEVDR